MAGIASNPGTTEIYIFRYQYLLVEVGGKILRSIFDLQVGKDLMQYLQNDPAKYQKLIWLKSRGIIKGVQETMLPPINKNPCTSDFDITLLSCLLQNICQLPPSLMADVMKIRECRNDLNHRSSVIINETEIEKMWKDLCKVLNRLNNFAKIINLSDQIEKIKHCEIDENLRKKLEDVIKQWNESEKLLQVEIERLKISQSELKEALSKCEERVQKQGTTLQDQGTTLQYHATTLQVHETKLQDITYLLDSMKDFDQSKQERKDQEEVNLVKAATALKAYLIKTYKETCSTLPVTALSEKDDEIELLKFYQPLEMTHKPYHRSTEDKTEYVISSFKEIFYKGEHCFKHIFLTGEAGVGKSSLCQCMTLLWSKVQANETFNNDYFQENAAFMKQFDFVFHISLRDTYRDNILPMVVDLLLDFNNNEDELQKLLTYISEQYNCLIILDGLDEWSPSVTGRKPQMLPRKLPSDKCIYLTACRPYKIENERLTTRDIDHQVNIFGISEYENYVEAVIQYVNKTRKVQRDVSDFYSEIKGCDLRDHLCIPVITSQLILVWFKQKLTNMSRAVIYGKIVEMLFERADKKKPIELSQIQSCDLQVPKSFIELNYIRKYGSLIEKVCLLAFRSLFKQDDNVSALVFTSKKLMSEPYCITNAEMDFLCKLGILSKHKVIGNVGERELKLSFLHNSFIEFYAAMYVSSFDKKDDFHSVIMKWTKLIEVFEYENFLLLLSGLCHQKVNFVLDTIYNSLSDDIQFCRYNDFVSKVLLSGDAYHLKPIQNLVIKLFIEIKTYVDKNVCLRLDDFTFSKHSTNRRTLNQLLMLNRTNVKYLYTDGIFHDEFNKICNLQILNIKPWFSKIPQYVQYDESFDRLMLQNKTTLHTICFKGFVSKIFLSNFPIRDLHHLTSLYLYNIAVSHKCLHDIADHLSNNVNIQSINLVGMECSEHKIPDSNCLHRTNLQHSCNIRHLYLSKVNIIVSKINTSSLKCVTLCSSSIDLFKYLESSQLEYLNVESFKLDDNTVNQLVDTIKTLSCIKTVKLNGIDIPDHKYLLLHSDVTEVEIELKHVTMSDTCFLSFVQCCTSKKANIVVDLGNCIIIKHDGERYRDLSHVLLTSNESLHDNKDLLLHSDVTQVKIKLTTVTMSDRCFLSFVQCCTSKKANIVVEVNGCKIEKLDGDDYKDFSHVESTNNESLQDNKDLLQYSDATQVKIKLNSVEMSDECSLSFVQCCTSKKANIVVEVNGCKIKTLDGDNYRYLSNEYSWDYMYQHLTSIPNVIITETDRRFKWRLTFKTRNCH